MILIADSGSTKTEWNILSDQGLIKSLLTSGINPFYQDTENIAAILIEEFSSSHRKFDSICFYGAGCINPEKQEIVKRALLKVFSSNDIFVGSDLLAATRALCQDQPGVACILGTGSNSCYYNGNEIVDQVSPLGFILGDEGSGAVLGKKLLSDVLKKQLSSFLTDAFFETYHTNAAEILENVYKRPFPSRYLAGYTKFLSKNIQHPEIEQIVISGFQEFVTRNLLQYSKIKDVPVHFAGGVAFYFEPQLRKVIEQHNLHLGQIIQAPMDGLMTYHLNKLTAQNITQ